MKITKETLRQLIREEIIKEHSKQQMLKEDASLIGDIALGVAGGIAGLYALVGGVKLLGAIAAGFAEAFKDRAKKAKQKAEKEGRIDAVKSIVKKFEGDSTLKGMYQKLTPYNKNPKERAKQLTDIAKYVKSKLTSDEMEYFTDISSMLRTGDIKK